jgi:hypothetical protein
MPIVIIPVVVLLVCGFVQFWFYRRIRQALIKRHPELWLSISYKAWFVDGAATGFAFSRRVRDLGDPVLMATVNQARLLLLIALLAFLALVGLSVTGNFN